MRIKGSDEFQRETESTDYYYYDEKDNDDDDISISFHFKCTLTSRHENSYKTLLKNYYVKINSFLFNSHIYLWSQQCREIPGAKCRKKLRTRVSNAKYIISLPYKYIMGVGRYFIHIFLLQENDSWKICTQKFEHILNQTIDVLWWASMLDMQVCSSILF